MSFLMAGLNSTGTITLQGCLNIATSYPSFEHTLQEITRRCSVGTRGKEFGEEGGGCGD